MTLTIDGVGDFDVVQFTATFAKNEIPRCTCLVSIGRDARSQSASSRRVLEQSHLQGDGVSNNRRDS
jgi:hypothetical protein